MKHFGFFVIKKSILFKQLPKIYSSVKNFFLLEEDSLAETKLTNEMFLKVSFIRTGFKLAIEEENRLSRHFNEQFFSS